MELCGPDLRDRGGPLCQVKHLPHHGAPRCRLQAGGPGTQNLPHQPWVNQRPMAVACRPTVAHAPRASGAVAPSLSSQEGASSRKGEEAAMAMAPRGLTAGRVLVTGGAGYFGSRLGRDLAGQGMSVILLDVNTPPRDVPDGATYFQPGSLVGLSAGWRWTQEDIRDYSALYKLCEGVDCIFHTASYGMSGPEQLRKEQVESVNVGGTKNVINVCKDRNIPRLVYTSTINVVFTGQPIEECDESSASYVPPGLYIDHYSRTKAIAEQMILSADRIPLRGGGLLRTCALRPSGIYGPDERRHLYRVMRNVERRLFFFRFGDPRARMNWVHVDNLILAHRLAAEALTQQRDYISSGQVYFINDGVSVNLFEWLSPLFENLGYNGSLIRLPVTVVCLAANLVEYLHVFLRPLIEVPLLFTQNEVRSIAVSHTFKIDKARRELGYCPRTYSLVDCVEQYLKNRRRRPERLSSNLLLRHLLLLLLLGLSLMLVTVFSPI
ncbi:putative short-chain dehydrogenase/reductase family 42E member 2 [Takifugu flavidus]|uniref:Putative short-chain dehydrogenase/reductase family 42E member 2 n=1 Tax=Takifugu flavidus TaxID=433684 RepID=A0A5C6NWC8_9TELE|nr:putative short-chain dehydrogenase/reductase family 42E member 2 [Takifugu flavidus]